MTLPLTPTRDEGRRWAERKLSEPEYREADLSPLEKLGRTISRFFDSLIGRASDLDSPWTLVVIAVLIAAIIGLLIWRLRRGTSGGVDLAAYDAAQRRSSVDPQAFWDAAHAAAGAGDYTLAVQNGTRAIFARLVTTGHIDMTAASTASELARAAGAACPAADADARAVGSLFDAVTFGEAHATAEDWQDLLARAERIRLASPATASGTGSHAAGTGGAGTGASGSRIGPSELAGASGTGQG